ncbi:hypothetical protein GCM10029964_029260 [Kibdelosporangium lantanae]
MEYTAEHLIGTGEHEISIMDMNTQDDVAAAVRGQDLVLMGVRNVDSGMDNEAPELPLIKSIVGRFRDAYDGPIGIAGSAVNLSAEGVRDYLGVEYALVSKGFGAIDRLLGGLSDGSAKPGIIRDYTKCVSGVFQRNVIDKEFYLKDGGRIGVATKFGCPFRCQHCDYPAIDGRVITMRPPAEVVTEVGNLHRAGIDKIFFADAQFNIPVKHAIAILEGMLAADLGDVDWDGFINPHKAAFNERLAKLYRAFGKNQVHFGVDSLSDRVLRQLRKGFTVDDVRNAVRMCRDQGMEVSCSLLFGSPSETLESVRRRSGTSTRSASTTSTSAPGSGSTRRPCSTRSPPNRASSPPATRCCTRCSTRCPGRSSKPSTPCPTRDPNVTRPAWSSTSRSTRRTCPPRAWWSARPASRPRPGSSRS